MRSCRRASATLNMLKYRLAIIIITILNSLNYYFISSQKHDNWRKFFIWKSLLFGKGINWGLGGPVS